ncbi:hypothetical protein Y695_02182 [Hydrogenophaga sp. T4]|nr:hypothetical protein Y695_02182 [Hydrogenophaga sp. T4]
MSASVPAKSSEPRLTCMRRRVSGLSVVSQSCSAFISPRPLKRLIWHLSRTTPSFSALSRMACSSPSSSAYCLTAGFLPRAGTSTRNSGGRATYT